VEEIHIVACETLKPEISLVMRSRGCAYPIAWVESGKHVWPDKLHVAVQETIDKIPRSYTTILLVFGFCGNAMVGIKANGRRLVLPRAADCIPLFLGSQKKRDEYGVDTYFFTEGYLNSESSFATEYNVYVTRYGEKRGLSITKKMMEHYKHITVIDTGAFNTDVHNFKPRSFSHTFEYVFADVMDITFYGPQHYHTPVPGLA
jgi:hypothetical protein